ncbi:Zinc finger and SCAN domain-containing protein 5B [Holothuria leucospilota]|uniref:Zinc finger and SCAN domain-containing protein 5B n=1 Tax=Holothuria leucospilota TaxID=206669 RepID=A0A9Q1BBY6_HOLLE|nr:Zinc finger and SCAN domain-containing protein 5B [Holothuria leucospilota]
MEKNSSDKVMTPVVNIMKDAVFQEIVNCVENDGIILALLQGSKDDVILRQVVNMLQTVKVLGLTHDTCKVLISHKTDDKDLGKDTAIKDISKGVLAQDIEQCTTQMIPQADVSIEESMKTALFEEIVQSILRRECSLIVAAGLKSEKTLQAAMNLLGNVRLIYLAPDACDVLLVNSVKAGKKRAARIKMKKSLADERTCTVCMKQFSKRSGLLTHQKAFHKKYLPHKCDICERAFVYPKELKVHKMSHTGERPYHCDVCNKGFIARKDLQRHHPVHTGERAFCCTMCDAKFAHKANLGRHVRSKHEGRRPYVCSLCDKKYCDRGGLRKHLASVHQIFDTPKKKAQTVFKPLNNDENVSVSDKAVVSGEVGITSDDHIMESLSSSSLEHPPSSSVQLINDISSVESASKILQQLSQTVAEFSEHSTSREGYEKGFNLSHLPSISTVTSASNLMVPGVVSGEIELVARQETEGSTGESVLNIAYTNGP